MSLLEFEPRSRRSDPIISIGIVVSEAVIGWPEDQFSYKGKPSGILPESPPLHLFLDGDDVGTFDWEISSDGRHGYIDALDDLDQLKARQLKRTAMAVIIECMHDCNPDLQTIDYLNAQEVFRTAA